MLHLIQREAKSIRRLLLFCLFSCSSWLCSFATASEYQLQVVAEKLNYPWSMAFFPNGDLLLSMHTGELRVVTGKGDVGEPIANTPSSFVDKQLGYLDVVLDPEYLSNQIIYLCFIEGSTRDNATSIIKARLVDNQLEDVTTIFTMANRKDTPFHHGGRLQFLGDGTLVLTTGDGFQYREAAQDTFNQIGKIIRINRDGSIPLDNPFADGQNGDPKVYAYGLRNPQGLVYDGISNTLYLNEHGPKGGDEVNIVTRGSNFGWPVTSYGIDYSGARISPFQQQMGIVDPIKYWTPSIAPSGMAFYRGAKFPAWQGDLFIGGLVSRDVRRLELENGQVANEEILFAEIDERIRDVRTSPEGYLYILTDSKNGKLIRVSPR